MTIKVGDSLWYHASDPSIGIPFDMELWTGQDEPMLALVCRVMDPTRVNVSVFSVGGEAVAGRGNVWVYPGTGDRPTNGHYVEVPV